MNSIELMIAGYIGGTLSLIAFGIFDIAKAIRDMKPKMYTMSYSERSAYET